MSDPLENVLIQTINYRGHEFRNFFVAQSPAQGPGWYVFGRNSEKYGTLPNGDGAYVMLCARPDVPPRSHRHYNGQVRRGWHTKREAQAAADQLNREYPR